MIARVFVNLLMWCLVFGRTPPPVARVHRDVTTSQGVVRGYLSPRPPHFSFLGLPYARPPRQRDRFKAPEPPPIWDGIFEASHRIKCLQGNGEGEEDCLVVNVFVPEHAGACCALPVLVFVHDGGYQNGWGAYQPPVRFYQDFVVVTFNYRLGVLGFLCAGTPDAPGNAGLKDQVAALYWVHRNIDSFGGNPHDVTVYGTGSGAASVQMLLLSGLTRELLHRVILESGSVLSPSSLAYNPFSTALEVAFTLGYEDRGEIDELVAFYQDIPMTQLVNISMRFLPCIEQNIYYADGLFDHDPMEILRKNDNIHKIPMLVIYTNAEEISLIQEYSARFNAVPGDFNDLLPDNLEFPDEHTRQRVAALIKEFYFEEIDCSENLIQVYADYINDIVMEYPTVKFSTLYASQSFFPVYLMKFSYKFATQEIPGASHRDVLKYMYREDNLQHEEQLVIVQLVTLLNNFIKLGDPTPLTTSLVPVIWQPINKMENISRVFCLLFNRTLKMDPHLSRQQLTFWDHIYSKFYKLHLFDVASFEYNN